MVGNTARRGDSAMLPGPEKLGPLTLVRVVANGLMRSFRDENWLQRARALTESAVFVEVCQGPSGTPYFLFGLVRIIHSTKLARGLAGLLRHWLFTSLGVDAAKRERYLRKWAARACRMLGGRQVLTVASIYSRPGRGTWYTRARLPIVSGRGTGRI